MKREKPKNPPNCYLAGNGKSWIVDFVFRGRRCKLNLGPVSRSVAKEKSVKFRSDVADGDLAIAGQLWNGRKWAPEEEPSEVRDPLFEEFLEEFLAERKDAVKPSSYERLVTSSVALKPFFSGMRLSKISEFAVERYRLERRKACSCRRVPRRHKATGGRCPECGHFYKVRSVSTVNRELTLLKAMLRRAKDRRWLDEIPNVVLYDEPDGRQRFLSEEEAGRLLAVCDVDFRRVVLTAMYTGCRSGELRTLTWRNVDMNRRRITIASAYSKNGRMREVPMTDDVFRTFGEMREGRDPKPDNPVFVRRYGRPWRSWETAWRGAVKRAKIEDFRFHDLRHNFASWLAMNGVVEKARADLMGHSDTKMQARYSHLSMDYHRAAVAKLPTLGHLAAQSPSDPPSAGEAKVVGFGK
jgi:integrase